MTVTINLNHRAHTHNLGTFHTYAKYFPDAGKGCKETGTKRNVKPTHSCTSVFRKFSFENIIQSLLFLFLEFSLRPPILPWLDVFLRCDDIVWHWHKAVLHLHPERHSAPAAEGLNCRGSQPAAEMSYCTRFDQNVTSADVNQHWSRTHKNAPF